MRSSRDALASRSSRSPWHAAGAPMAAASRGRCGALPAEGGALATSAPASGKAFPHKSLTSTLGAAYVSQSGLVLCLGRPGRQGDPCLKRECGTGVVPASGSPLNKEKRAWIVA
jgi:hypothetical protein